MDQTRAILLCGGTGALGGLVAQRLGERGLAFRALVRPGSDASALEALGAAVVRGDLREPATLDAAVDGIDTVISTANAIGRRLAGERELRIGDVDDLGYANLVAAAERAEVARFVYVSMLGDFADARTPFTDAKAATEARLRASTLREVVVRPDMFQEVWLGAEGGFDAEAGKVTIYGHGTARHRLVATADVAEAVVRVALAADPPRVVELAGPEAVSVTECAEQLERVLGRPVHVTHVPRIAMRVGRTLLRGVRPEVASVMGMALVGDLADTTATDEEFRRLGIAPRAPSAYIAQVVAHR